LRAGRVQAQEEGGMSTRLNVIHIYWDPEDQTRIMMTLDDVDISMDHESARNIAAALITMADRAEKREQKAVNQTIDSLEGKR
jgi:hypothetical protein